MAIVDGALFRSNDKVCLLLNEPINEQRRMSSCACSCGGRRFVLALEGLEGDGPSDQLAFVASDTSGTSSYKSPQHGPFLALIAYRRDAPIRDGF
jgi:hypothetical protein